MSTSILEIVELSEGEVVLQNAEGDSSPLVTIRFSDETSLYLMGNGLEVARAMIQAGIQAATELAERGEIEVEGETSASESTRILH